MVKSETVAFGFLASFIGGSLSVGAQINAKEARDRVLKSLTEPPPYRISGKLVSIIIPTWQEADFIGNCLKSLRNQTYQSIEIIIADWKSTDGTQEIAEEYGAKVIECEKPGIAYACNLAARHSEGPILLRTDADVIMERIAIEKLVEAIHKPRIVCAHAGVCLYDGPMWVETWIRWLKPAVWTSGRSITVWRNVFWQLRGFDEERFPAGKPGEDRDFGYRLIRKYPKGIAYLASVYVGHSSRRLKRYGYITPKGFPAVRNKILKYE